MTKNTIYKHNLINILIFLTCSKLSLLTVKKESAYCYILLTNYIQKYIKVYLVGNFDSHVLQQFGRFGGAICTSHCLNFSNANGSPGCRTSGFYNFVGHKSII